MKKLILTILLSLIAISNAHAQCVAEIKAITQDPIRGSIIAKTEYTLNGKVVQQGKTRYLETNGTAEEIEAKIKADIAEHCENLIRRIPENQEYLSTKKLERQKELTTPIITSLQDVVGYKTTKTEAIDNFKDKDIKVTYDQKNSISAGVSSPVIGE